MTAGRAGTCRSAPRVLWLLVGTVALSFVLLGCRSDEAEEGPDPTTTTAPDADVASSETSSTTVFVPSIDEVSPDGLGDDALLDLLWGDCESGSGEACDELFRRAPVGSTYEEFGYTCGDRPEVIVCTDLDGGAG